MQAIFELAIFVQNNVLNYELLKIIVFSQKRQENNKLTKKAFVNLPKLFCVVNNI